jgi:hypothetical protein
MDRGRIRCLMSPAGPPFVEVDTAEDYRHAVDDVYPRILRMEAAEDDPCDVPLNGLKGTVK